MTYYILQYHITLHWLTCRPKSGHHRHWQCSKRCLKTHQFGVSYFVPCYTPKTVRRPSNDFCHITAPYKYYDFNYYYYYPRLIRTKLEDYAIILFIYLFTSLFMGFCVCM